MDYADNKLGLLDLTRTLI